MEMNSMESSYSAPTIRKGIIGLSYFLDFITYSAMHLTDRIGIVVLIYVETIVVQLTEEVFDIPGNGITSILITAAICYWISMTNVGKSLLCFAACAEKVIRKDHLNILSVPFQRAIVSAKRMGLELPEKIDLYTIKDEKPFVFALSMEAVCVSTAMMEMPEEIIEANMSQAMCHISRRDPEILQISIVGSLLLCWGFGIIAIFLVFMYRHSRDLTDSFSAFILLGIIAATSMILLLLVRGILRKSDYIADAHVYQTGLGNELCGFIDATREMKAEGLAGFLEKTHPSTDRRVGRLQKMGATYMM